MSVRALLGLAAVLAWAALAVWHAVKPLPPGTHVASLATRVGEAQVTLVADRDILGREQSAVDRAEQLVVVDQRALPVELAQHLLWRQRQRPNLKVVVIVDPADPAYGGTAPSHLAELEAAGIIVARVRLELLRDSNPLYSACWRLTVAWWSDPFDEAAADFRLRSDLRRRNGKADRRQLLAADDGSGGWIGILAASAGGDLAVELRGVLTRDIITSELRIAGWSTDDDRLPVPPPTQGRIAGALDVRFLTEGAIAGALAEAIAGARGGDAIDLTTRVLAYRPLIGALLRAAARGVRVRVILAAAAEPNRTVAAELEQGALEQGALEVRWTAAVNTSVVEVHRGPDFYAYVSAADFTRPDLGDFNLSAALELRSAARAAAARVLTERFTAAWAGAAPAAAHAQTSQAAYWRYRLLEATGLAPF